MVDTSRNCPFCGGSIPAGVAACPACGNESVPSQSPVQMNPATAQTPQRSGGGSSMGCVITIVIALLVLGLMVAGGMGYFWTAGSEPVVEPYSEPTAPPSSMPFAASNTVTLRVNVEPAGAQILIDNSLVGTSPLVVERPISANPLRIEARMPGYHAAQQTVVPQNDSVISLVLARDQSDEPTRAEQAPSPSSPGGDATTIAGSPQVRGSLSPEVIRRVIGRHINTIRYCYEQQLARAPNLSGRISMRLVISSDGTVTSSSVASSTVNNPEMESCVARSVRRIRFPPPEGGGVVIVTYPFNFRSAE